MTCTTTKAIPDKADPSARRWPQLRPAHLWMLLPSLTVVWMGFMHPLRRLDFWWHLKAGEIIVTTRQIPRVDLFSFTQTGRPFLYEQYWLGEALYYLIYHLGGLALLIASNTLLLWLTIVMIQHLCFEATQHTRLAALCSMIAAIVLGLYSNTRPQAFSIVLFAIFYWIVWRYCEGHGDHLWVLPVLMILWVNLHGGFVLGLGLLGLVLATEMVRRALGGRGTTTLTPRALARLSLFLGLTVLACLINPAGARMFAYARQIQAAPAVQSFVTEWQVPDIKSSEAVLSFFGPLFLAVAAFAYTRRRLNLTEMGLFLTFAVLGLQARRNAIWFVLVVSPMLARHLDALETPDWLTEWQNRLTQRGQAVEQQDLPPSRAIRGLGWVILVALATFTLLLSPWLRPLLHSERLRSQLVEKGTPIGAMDYIAAHGLQGNIFHPEEYGDYLIWRLWPQQRSFIDGRVHLFDQAFLQEYVLLFHAPDWEARLARYDIRYLLLPKDDSNARYLLASARGSAGWALLYEDDTSALFAKRP